MMLLSDEEMKTTSESKMAVKASVTPSDSNGINAKSIKQYSYVILLLTLASVFWMGFQSDNSLPSSSGSIDALHQVSGDITVDDQPHYLEELMYHYGSDKSKDDHSYTDLYQMLFNPIRKDVRHVMEVGVAAGQSIQAWYHYFPNAQIHAFDVTTMPSVKQIVRQHADRTIFYETNLLHSNYSTRSGFDSVGLRNISVDILIEDAMHTPRQQQEFLARLFPLVKPGGYYIVEDIAMSRGPARVFQENPENLSPAVQEILQSNDAVFMDTHIGHRDWNQWKSKSGQVVQSHSRHNSHLLVIRKRVTPVPPVKMFVKTVAMNSDMVTLDPEKAQANETLPNK